jgi:hypothetical protein
MPLNTSANKGKKRTYITVAMWNETDSGSGTSDVCIHTTSPEKQKKCCEERPEILKYTDNHGTFVALHFHTQMYEGRQDSQSV